MSTSRFTVIILLISLTFQCIGQNRGQNVSSTAKFDTFPRGRVEVKRPTSSKDSYLFVFYDKNGEVAQEISDKNLPIYSKFENLDFPKMLEAFGEPILERIGGMKYYDIREQSVAKRKEVLQKSGVTGVPDSVIERSTNIYYYGTGIRFNKGDRFIIATGLARFFDESPKDNIYTCFDQTHITIYDSTGTIFKQLDINHSVSNEIMSDNGRYLMAIFNKYHRYDGDTYDIPIQIFDFMTNKIDTIDLRNEFPEFFPLRTLYGDSLFQILLDGVTHLLIDPTQRKIYSRPYDYNRFKYIGNGFKFKSMHLPDDSKINIQEYQIKSY